jgi:hypothetical protein
VHPGDAEHGVVDAVAFEAAVKTGTESYRLASTRARAEEFAKAG